MNKCDEIVYLDYFDAARHASLHPHRIVPSNMSRDEVFANVNYNVYYAMGSDKPFDSPDGVLAAEPQAYEKLLSQVLEVPGVKFLTALELSSATPQANEITCHVRHDVDADIVAALHLARIEKKLGIRTTYYLLHTAAYYGTWNPPGPGGVVTFSRNEALAEVYLELQSLGHEVAIHADALTLYQQHNVDGSSALVAEIDWLRSIGLDIRGTAPHNNYFVYGADNSAIFRGRNLHMGHAGCPKGVIFNGRWAPLQHLDEAALGLIYEANKPFELDDSELEFMSITKSDLWWHYHQVTRGTTDQERQDRKAFWGTHHEIMKRLRQLYPMQYPNESNFWLDHDSVVRTISEIGRDKLVIFAVHPEYYGRRASPTSEPVEVLQVVQHGPTAEHETTTWMNWLRAKLSKRTPV